MANIKTILVIGLGRIGLPQALLLANSGFTVYGYDRNKIDQSTFSDRYHPFFERGMNEIFQITNQKKFFPFSDINIISEKIDDVDCIIFTIGTQVFSESDLENKKSIDFSKYHELIDFIFCNDKKVKKEILIIIRTTMPIDGTNSIKSYIEEKYFLKEGSDFHMAFVPERITEGNAFEEYKKLPVIVGAYSDTAFKLVSEIFSKNESKIIRVKNPRTAEFCKLTDNSFRNTMFAYSNEIAMYANEIGINVNEVISSVNDSYERNHIPLPGYVSGYCLSKDPYIFEIDFMKKMPDRNFHSLWYFGRKTNDFLISSTVKKVFEKIKKINLPCVCIVGLSFNKDVDDYRVSHAISIILGLIDLGVKKFKLYDPNINRNKYTKISDEISSYVIYQSSELSSTLFDDASAIVVCSKFNELEKNNEIQKLSNLFSKTKKPCYLFDGWYVWNQSAKISHIEYESIGYHHD